MKAYILSILCGILITGGAIAAPVENFSARAPQAETIEVKVKCTLCKQVREEEEPIAPTCPNCGATPK